MSCYIRLVQVNSGYFLLGQFVMLGRVSSGFDRLDRVISG